MANTKKGGKGAAGQKKAQKTMTVQAADVLAVNEDGSMEPLTEAIPEIAPDEPITVDVPAAPEAAAPQSAPPAQIVYAAMPQEPMVKLLYLDSAIENNEVPIGGGRVVTGSGRVFAVKLSDFEGTFLTPLVLAFLKKRKFIVLDGLTDELREQYGVNYREGEIVKNGFMTLIQNGICVQNNVELTRNTPGGVTDYRVAEGPLLLQCHGGDPVSYRNVWFERL